MNTFKQTALNYNKLMNINVLPLKGKRPMINWDKWQSEVQTVDDINTMEWNTCTGIGGVQGINDWRCLDLDKVEDFEIVELILTELGLPENYSWVVQSGSGEGFHIYCLIPNPSPKEKGDSPHLNPLPKGEENFLHRIGGEKAVYKFYMKNNKYCKHIELRWMNCQTALPPSMHESGGIYNFYFDEPKEPPAYIELEKVIGCLGKFGEVANVRGEKQEVKSKREREQGNKWEHGNGKPYYDKERLESALDFLAQHLPDGSYEEWYKIGFALVPLEEIGEKYFVEMSLKNPKYKDNESELRKKFNSLVKDYDGRVTIGTIYHIAEMYGWKKPIIKFWFRENDHLKISRIRFKKFLESEGFCKYKIESNHLFVRIENNIVDEIDSVDVKEFVMNFLDQTATEELEGTNRNEIIDALIKSNNQLFTQQFLEFLITKNIEFNKDTFSKGYFYFRNGFVSLTPSPSPKERGETTPAYLHEGKGERDWNIEFHEYKKLNKCIWRKQIILRNYEPSNRRSVFEDFIFNICRNEVKRFEALKSGIGYLLHTYKDPSIAKAVVFIDEKLSEGAFGRSGKGVVIKAIGHVRNVVIEEGRNFNPSKNFAFQRVKADTNVIGFEDIRDKFPFERLFSIITDGITIERKNKDEIHIGYSESPKIVISTNYSISGVDDSTLDRQFIIEFSDYYKKEHRPVHDFGKPFFGGWDESEWSDFDNLMISCLQLYLRKGLVEYEFVNIDKKKMIDETCQEFVEFAESIEGGKEYEKKELYEDFKREYEDFTKLTQSKFTRWLKVWGRIKNYEVREGKSGSRRTIGIGK